MKRTFTFISMALAFMAGYAQSSTTQSNDEEWAVVEQDGTLKADYKANDDPNSMSVVNFSTTNVTGTHTSGPVAGYIDGELVDGKLTPKVDNTWGAAKGQALSKDESVPTIYYVQGKGNPVNLDKIEYEEIESQGTKTGTYRVDWTNSYYAPDGSNGLPTNGTYVTLTPKVAGTMIAYVWVNKGGRATYIAKKSDAKALAFGTDIKVSGYVQATNNDDVAEDSPLYGYMKYQENIAMKGTEGTDAYVIGAGSRPVWVGLTFKAEANETYYVFNSSTQIGFAGFVFTPGDAAGISDVTVSGNSQKAVRYNISGQQVDASYKGLVIENGKKFVQK